MKQTSETAFEPDWLRLREPVDHRARDLALLKQAAGCVSEGKAILDLGSGTGSTARAFARAGFPDLRWRFLDNDPSLLRIAVSRHSGAECIHGDLRNIGDLPLDQVGLITASALFDLMPEHWLNALIRRACDGGIPIYTALNYDGAMRWSPEDPRDNPVTQAFNKHQRSDKGLGPALGPDSGRAFVRSCEANGYDVKSAQSPWHLGTEDLALHDQLLVGIARAAQEAGASQATAWANERRDALTGTLGLIGHTDHLAVPR